MQTWYLLDNHFETFQYQKRYQERILLLLKYCYVNFFEFEAPNLYILLLEVCWIVFSVSIHV